MKVWNVALALLMLAGASVLAFGQQEAVAEPVGSAVVVNGRPGYFGDDFSPLTITVSQTRDLVSQAISVRWTGGTPTREKPFTPGTIGTNYLQIMQCWGDPAAAGDPLGLKFRETCQWGGAPESSNGRRSLLSGQSLETLPADAQMVPFLSASTGERSADGSASQSFPPQPCGAGLCPGTDTSTLSPFFSQFTTNEVYQAVTTISGTGEATFEVQTAVQSPHLGCGNPDRLRCWLVVVPRGERGPSGQVDEFFFGPLAAAAWQDRIVVPLDFVPRTNPCPIGAAERRTIGTEFIVGAMGSWQPAMCASSSKIFGYAPVGDSETARALRSQSQGAAGLGFTIDTVTPAPGGPTIFHAPVAINSAVIAFNIDVRIDPGTAPPPEYQLLQGTQVKDLNLTPLTVAKLLTQYYKRDVPGGNDPQIAPHVKDNPRTVRDDPQFLADNEVFKYFPASPPVDGLMVTGDNSVAAREVWRWVLADPEARAFLTGPSLNVYYKPLFQDGNVPPNFPKDDPTTFKPDPNAAVPYTTIHLRPPVPGLEDGARQALRADARSQVVWDVLSIPPRYRPQAPTEYGKRFSLVITDAASAARYGLPTAKLRNRAGEFTPATNAAVLKAVEAMEQGTINPVKTTSGAYPLPMVVQAAMDGSESAEARADYASLVRFAVENGQTPGVRKGELPPGYVPLPSGLVLAAKVAAQQLQQYTYSSPVPAPTTAPAVIRPRTQTPTTPPAIVTTAPSKSPPSYVAETTKATPLGNVRYVLAGCLAIGAVALLLGPLLRRRGTVHAP